MDDGLCSVAHHFFIRQLNIDFKVMLRTDFFFPCRKEPTKVLLLAHLSEIMNAAMDHSHITSSALQVKSEPTYSIMDISLNSLIINFE